EREKKTEMAAIANIMSLSSVFTSSKSNLMAPKIHSKMCRISCKVPESGVEENPTRNASSLSSKNRMEDYNTAMKRMMRNPYEYHHDLGGGRSFYKVKKPEDIDHLKSEENVAYILNLQQDKDIDYW
ncbi:hypothetical protein Tsubulata_003826, partial [Turnera subulata]